MRLPRPKKREVLSSVTMRCEKPVDKADDAAKDVCLSLDLIRRSRPLGSIKLAGKPGELPKSERDKRFNNRD